MDHPTSIAILLLLICVIFATDSAAMSGSDDESTSYDSRTESTMDSGDALAAGRDQIWKEKEAIEAEIMDKVGKVQIDYLIFIHMTTSKPPPADYLPPGTKEEEPSPLEEEAAYVMFTQWFRLMRERKEPDRPMSALKVEFDKVYEEVLLEPCRAATEIYESHLDYYVKSRELKMESSEFTPVGALRPISEYCKRLAKEEMKEMVFSIVDRDVRHDLS